MFYLYKKTHQVTGLRYLGYTKKDPFIYRGSGVVWLRHLKAHGEYVDTEVLCTCETKEEVRDVGRYYSALWRVVESSEWANLKAEEADGGDMRGSQTWVESRQDPNFKAKQAAKSSGNTNVRGKRWWRSVSTGELKRSTTSPGDDWVEGFIPRSDDIKSQVSEKLKGRNKTEDHKRKLSESARGRIGNNKGTVWVVNGDGVRRRVLPDNIPNGFELVKGKTQND